MNSQHIEVSHDTGFDRYVVYKDLTNAVPQGVIKLIDADTTHMTERELSKHEDVIIHVSGCDFGYDLDKVYYIRASFVYTDPEETYSVHINETNDVAFNIPINLMYTAACSRSCLMKFKLTSDIWPSITLERRHSQICVNYDSVYMIGTYTDMLTLNEMTPRCVEFIHGVMLIRNLQFMQQINNGNLMQAYADIYHGNLDDDIIVITDPTSKITSLHYDQFTGTVTDNTIEVCFSAKNEVPRYFNSNELDNEFVELLTSCIIQRITDLRNK